MKKIFITSLLALAIFAISCSDSFLDPKPSTQIPGDEGYTARTIEFQMIGSYLPMQWFDLWMAFPIIGDAMGDDIAIGGGSTSDQAETHDISRYRAEAVNHSGAIWNSSYKGIFRTNIILKNIHDINMNEAVKARLIAEAYALRTFYYYQLWRFYGNIPYFENNPTDILNDWKDIKQYSADEIYEKLIVDIDKALSGTALPTTVAVSELGRFTRGAALMLKAHMVIMQKDVARYNGVIENMKEIINTHGYSLVQDFASIWEDSGEWGTESIFEINYTDVGSSRGWGDPAERNPGGSCFPTLIGINGFSGDKNIKTYAAGWGFMPMMKHLYNLYDDTDQRKNGGILSFDYYKANVDITAKYDTTRWDNTGLFNKKYLPRAGGNAGAPAGQGDLNYRNNQRVYRLADTYLIASELLVRTGQDQALADSYLNIVRARAYKNQGNYEKTATLDNILAERRLEFSGEGHRFFDLLRFDKAEGMTKQLQIGWDNVGNERIRTYGTFTYTSASRYFPIPQSEVDRSLGAIKQNSGY